MVVEQEPPEAPRTGLLCGVARHGLGEKSSRHTGAYGPISGNRVKLSIIKDCLPLPPPTFAFRKWPHHPCSHSIEPEGWELFSAHPPSRLPLPTTSELPLFFPIGPKFVQLFYSSNNLLAGSILPPSDLSVMLPPESQLSRSQA